MRSCHSTVIFQAHNLYQEVDLNKRQNPRQMTPPILQTYSHPGKNLIYVSVHFHLIFLACERVLP